MYEDIEASLNKALIQDKWNEGDRLHRIGNPFRWADVDIAPGLHLQKGLSSLLKHFTQYYEQYPTPETIRCDDFDDVFAEARRMLGKVFRLYFPWIAEDEYSNYLDSMALARTQDYGFIKTFVGRNGPYLRHLDLGPGIGSHLLYSRVAFKSLYCGLEAYPESYQVQREFFRALSCEEAPYIDFVAAETFGQSDEQMSHILRSRTQGIIHVPSWKFPLIADRSFDIVTATFMLNELNHAGVLWLISGAVRALKEGGFFYIRDSSRLKPGLHDVNYDELLLSLGFEEVARLKITNRVDFHGVPRAYIKASGVEELTFDELVERVMGHFGVGVRQQASNIT